MNDRPNHYRSRRPGQAGLEKRIKELCETRVRYGYRRIHVPLRREGWTIDQKKTRRVYRELGKQLRNKTPKRRVKAKLRDDRCEATSANETWAMDFVHDQLATGQKPLVPTIVDTRFDDFSAANDPYGEHDFGVVEADGVRVFWKIDTYDKTLVAHSPDPTDPAVTRRVMTLVPPEEY